MNKKTKRNQGYMGIKIDIEKAYDRLKWSFIKKIVTNIGLPPNMINNIMNCVTTLKFDILINGSHIDDIIPTRGNHQGDPISPQLFIFCVDVFSKLFRPIIGKI